ncbi:MAG TPA: CHRD domain-containing protein [Rhizomicrobium sp.]|nr:CHRD domain-containing protein [Rhizomicrobium sp.]
MRHSVMGIVALLAIVPVSTAWAEDFETRLSPSPLTDGTRVNIAGEGRAKASLDARTLTISADFHGLVTPATTAQIYDGLGIAIPGPKAFDLTVTQATSGTVSGSVTLTAKQATDLRAGRFYVQINSQKAPDGNLTGWLLPPHPFAGEDVPVAGAGFLPQLDVPQKSSSR